MVGGETDIQVTGADDTFAPWKFSNPWFGTLRGRAGFALNNILFYGTLGLAYGGTRRRTRRLDETQTHVGWTGGLGMEVGLTPNWSAKVEYLYMDLGNRPYSITGVQQRISNPTFCASASTTTSEPPPSVARKSPGHNVRGFFADLQHRFVLELLRVIFLPIVHQPARHRCFRDCGEIEVAKPESAAERLALRNVVTHNAFMHTRRA